MSLNVMVLESDRGAADRAVHRLTEAGHVVLRCHEPGAPAFPCVGLVDQAACPLRAQVVDVALTVRSHSRAQPTAYEDGARCALMHRVPLVAAGPGALDPYANYEARLLDATDDIVGACEEVAVASLVRHGQVATAAIRAAREPDEFLAVAHAVVTRRQGHLLASLHGLGPLTKPQRDAAVVRVMAKLREFDTSARGIDIVLA